MERITRVCVYETTSADPSCTDEELQAQGRSMRDAMVADLMAIDGLQVSVAVLGEGRQDGLGAAPRRQSGNRGCDRDRSHRLGAAPLANLESPVDFIRRQASTHDFVWVVAPESGGVLAALRAAVNDRQWLGCSVEAIAITASKRATATHLRAAGIVTTEPLAAEDHPDEAVHHGDWVIKPDDGCGASGARRHRDHARAWADYADRRQRGEDVVMEPWIEGDSLSLSLLCGETSVEVLSINRQQLGFDPFGSLHFRGVTPQAVEVGEAGGVGKASDGCAVAMVSLARRIKDALPGLHGYVGVDVTWHPERGPVVIEINPRLTCAYEGLSRRIGFNVAERMLSLHRRTFVDRSSAQRETVDQD